jgi:DUF1365 family protein
MPMHVKYDWALSAPTRRLGVAMSVTQNGRRLFTAALELHRRELTGWRLACILVVYPFMTLQVIAGIYWQALLLKLRGCRTYVHPAKRFPARLR